MVHDDAENSFKKLEDIFTKKQIEEIVKNAIDTDNNWDLLKSQVTIAATDGVGYLGEYLNAILEVSVNGCIKTLPLFIKRIPHENQNKSKFIQELNCFERESKVLSFFKNLEEIDELCPWHTKTYMCDDDVIVMPDLAIDGYKHRDRQGTFDLEHMLVAAASLARFHAATANYQCKNSRDTKECFSVILESSDALDEAFYTESPLIYAGAKVAFNITKEFSLKFKDNISQLEEKLVKLYVKGCQNVKETENTLNVLLHRDLSTNNIMFKYNEGIPINSLLIDFQTIQYGPPASDLMQLFYMNSTRPFREQYENEILEHYFSTFMDSINNPMKERLQHLKYDFDEFKKWCNISRMFGLTMAITVLPYSIMDIERIQTSLNDPDKFLEYAKGDRSGPVVDHAKESENYKNRLLEVNEEFLERYVFC